MLSHVGVLKEVLCLRVGSCLERSQVFT